LDTHIVYPGQIPQDTDLLLTQKLASLSVGGLGDILYGRTAAAWGFSPTLSSTALTVTISAGIILASGPILPTALGGQGGGLPADATVTTKQYLLPSTQTLTFPGTGGTYTLYALCSDVDTDSTLLPFWSADNPTQTQAGPNNAGTQLATRRTSQVALTLAQSAPAAPANGSVIPLMTFTVPSGATNASGVTYSQIANTFWLTIPELQKGITAITPGRRLNRFVVTTSGTYQPSAGATLWSVRGVGAGGSGGSAAPNTTQGNVSAGGAGSGGAYAAFDILVSDLPAGGIDLTVGLGGVSTGNPGDFGGAGSPSIFGSFVTLGAGTGGYNSLSQSISGSAAAAYGGQVTFQNETPLKNCVYKGGEHGPSGMVFGTENNLSNYPGIGGNSPLGTGGTSSNNGTGDHASGFGGGGGGAGSNSSTGYVGGSGSPGVWIIEEWS